MDFKNKYLKYKNKYLELKKQLGGSFSDSQMNAWFEYTKKMEKAQGKEEKMQIIKDWYKQFKGKKIHGEKSALIQAVYHQNKKDLELLLSEDGLDINKKYEDKDGDFLLHYSVDGVNDVTSLQMLLEHPDIDVNVRNNYGQTALHRAVDSVNRKAVRLLLDHPNINTDLKNKYGSTPMDIAIYNLEGMGYDDVNNIDDLLTDTFFIPLIQLVIYQKNKKLPQDISNIDTLINWFDEIDEKILKDKDKFKKTKELEKTLLKEKLKSIKILVKKITEYYILLEKTVNANPNNYISGPYSHTEVFSKLLETEKISSSSHTIEITGTPEQQFLKLSNLRGEIRKDVPIIFDKK